MTPLVQWILVALGAVGAAGTWFRAWTAWREHKAAQRRETCRWVGPAGKISL